MNIYLENGLQGSFNNFKNCWEFKLHNKIVLTCQENELNETIQELIKGVS